MAGLVLSDNILYETAAGGGSSGNGTVFGVSFAPQLAINHSEANVVLTWPNNVAGFDYTGDTLLCNTRTRRCKLKHAELRMNKSQQNGPRDFRRLIYGPILYNHSWAKCTLL